MDSFLYVIIANKLVIYHLSAQRRMRYLFVFTAWVHINLRIVLRKYHHLNIAVLSAIIQMFQQKKMIIGLIMQLIHYVLFVSEKGKLAL